MNKFSTNVSERTEKKVRELIRETSKPFAKIFEEAMDDYYRRILGDNSPDEHMDSTVFSRILAADRAGSRLSLKKQSKRYIGKSGIKSYSGIVYGEADIRNSVIRLIFSGRVIEIIGDKRNAGLAVPENVFE